MVDRESEALKVLVVEDNPGDVRLLQEALLDAREGQFELLYAERVDRALQYLVDRPFDVILLDLALPDSHGLETLTQMTAAAPSVPVVVLTGAREESLSVEAIRAGAQDYLVKGQITGALLTQSLRYAVERKQSQEAISEKTQLNQILLDSFPCVALLIRPGTREVVASNKAAAEVGAVPGAKCFETFGRNPSPCPWCLAPELWETGKAHHRIVEGLGVLWDAHWIPVSEDLYMHFAFDITERERSERERRHLAKAIEHAAEAIVVSDLEGTIEYVNPAFETMTGYTPEEAVGQSTDIVKSDAYDDQEIRRSVEEGNVWRGLIKRRRKDGVLYEADTTVSLVRDASGRARSVVSISRDVTHEVELEAQLRQAQKLEALGTLAGGIAHDFNNILGAMIGFTELAMEELPQECNAASDLREVLSASGRAKDLIEQILTFTRQTETEQKPIRPDAIIKEALRLLRSSIPSSIDIVQNIDSNSATILADPSQLHQVVINICTNAYQAMMPERGTLTVELKPFEIDAVAVERSPQLREGRYLKLTIRDTGCGMDAETLERIFDPFFTTKEEGEGTGLGLSTVHGIVHSMGGTITVDSEPGEGATFDVYLPRVEKLAEKPATADGYVPLGQGEHILVVEDEEALRNVVRRQLEGLGYRVSTCALAVEAVEVFRKSCNAFDLILTDYTMPTMNGIELAHELSRIRPDMPIILATGFGEASVSAKAKDAGIRRLLKKPLHTDELGIVVRAVLDES